MDVLEELDKAGAVLLDRHFVYKSGKHGSGYINLDPVFPNPRLTREFCIRLLEPYRFDFMRGWVNTIAAPAIGGIVLAQVAAFQAISLWGKTAAPVWADKKGDGFVFERSGFVEHLRGKKVLVVEDLLTTGGSVYKVCREAEKHGASIIGVSAICNRGGVTEAQLEVPRLESLISVEFEAVDPDDCELCQNEVPIVEDIGHVDKFKAEHPDYKGGYRLLS